MTDYNINGRPCGREGLNGIEFVLGKAYTGDVLVDVLDGDAVFEGVLSAEPHAVGVTGCEPGDVVLQLRGHRHHVAEVGGADVAGVVALGVTCALGHVDAEVAGVVGVYRSTVDVEQVGRAVHGVLEGEGQTGSRGYLRLV